MAVDLPPQVLAAIRRHTADDDVVELAAQVTGVVRFALDRAIAHRNNPAEFPLAPDIGSLERQFLAAVARLPASSADALVAGARARLAPTSSGASSAVRQANLAKRQATYGFAGQHEPTGPAPIATAMRALKVPDGLRSRAERVTRRLHPPADNGARPRRPGPDRREPTARRAKPPTVSPPPPVRVPVALRLTVSDVQVVDAANELGWEELEFGAVVMDFMNGRSVTVPPVVLGKFGRKGSKDPFRPVQVCELDLPPGANLGTFVVADVFLGEIDRRKGRGGFASYVTENGHIAGREIAAAVSETLALAAWAVTGAAIGGPALAGAVGGALALGLFGATVAVVVGIASGAVAGLLLGYVLVGAQRDEIFDAQVVGQSVDPLGTMAYPATQPVLFSRSGASYRVMVTSEVVFGLGAASPQEPPFGTLEPIEDAVADANLQKIDHVVVLMLENRSFDQMLGFLTAVHGRTDVDGPTDEFNIHGGERFPVAPLADTVFDLDPRHSAGAVARQVAADPNEPETVPQMAGFVAEYVRKPDFDEAKGHRPGDVMGYYLPEQVPIYDFIAREFAVCDRWFSSFPGNTWINRTIALTGKPARSLAQNLFVGNEMPLREGATAKSWFRTIDEFNAGQPPGQQVDWRAYAHDFSSVFVVDPFHVPLISGRLRTLDRFLDDLASGELPQVSWLDPNYVDFGLPTDAELGDDGQGIERTRFPRTANDDHPPTDVAHGQALIATLLFSIMQSPLWEKMLFVITYDEHGGMYDHVKPPANPVPEEPDDPSSPFANLGVRVPALVVSPWVERGAVSTTQFDHASLAATILTRFCERNGQVPFVSDRVDAAAHLGHVLTSGAPRFVRRRARHERERTRLLGRDEPPALPRAVRDATLSKLGRRLLAAEARPRTPRPPTDLEQDMADVRAFVAANGGGPTKKPPVTADGRTR